MMNIPSAIVFNNADINAEIQTKLVTQLHIDEVMTFAEFNARVTVEPNYPALIHGNKLRILVILPDYHDATNRDLADLVLFYSNGLVTVLANKFGPPGLSLQLDRINIYDLLRNVGSDEVVILPDGCSRCYHNCCSNCCRQCGRLQGIFAIEYYDPSGVYCPNCDNIYNNEEFLNRNP